MLTETNSRPKPWMAVLDALATPHGIDRYLEWIRPTWPLSRVRATLVRVARPATGSITLHLVPNHSWKGFAAGQHIELSIEIDGVRHTRCYSPAGSAHERDEIELTLKCHAEGRVSRWLHEHARPGQVFELSPARGDFVLPDLRPERVLLISGGSGITPVMSMLRTLCDENHPGPITFLHYAASPSTLPYANELAEIASAHPNVRVARIFGKSAREGDFKGPFSREQLLEVEPAYASAETFVCGPERLMDAVQDLFEEQSLAERLHAESFRPPRYRIRPDEATGRVIFERSGVEIENDGRTLLELAEAAGLKPRSGCRRGICHTCVCRMSAGSVRHTVTGDALNATDVDIQPCVHTAAGDVHIDL